MKFDRCEWPHFECSWLSSPQLSDASTIFCLFFLLANLVCLQVWCWYFAFYCSIAARSINPNYSPTSSQNLDMFWTKKKICVIKIDHIVHFLKIILEEVCCFCNSEFLLWVSIWADQVVLRSPGGIFRLCRHIPNSHLGFSAPPNSTHIMPMVAYCWEVSKTGMYIKIITRLHIRLQFDSISFIESIPSQLDINCTQHKVNLAPSSDKMANLCVVHKYPKSCIYWLKTGGADRACMTLGSVEQQFSPPHHEHSP